jgi:hypothetical protein
MTRVHALASTPWRPGWVWWDNYKPSHQEVVPFARHLIEAAWAEYQKAQNRKVPRWILRFALRCLSLDPQPPASAVADSLAIIAIDLGCDFSNIVTSDDRYVQVCYMAAYLTELQ